MLDREDDIYKDLEHENSEVDRVEEAREIEFKRGLADETDPPLTKEEETVTEELNYDVEPQSEQEEYEATN